MNQHILGFIGAGNMARSLIGGLIADGYRPRNIWVSDVNQSQLDALQKDFGIHVTVHNSIVAEHANVLVLAVKPQMLRIVSEELASTVQSFKPLVVSIAAGINCEAIDRWMGGDVAIVRCMPNTPAMVKTGATGLYANASSTFDHRSWAEEILRAVGLTVWVDEEPLLDAVTALSGSGPAYFFLFMEARLLAQQTALGAGRIAIESQEGPAELRRRVTSPGGTTERAIAVFEAGGLRTLTEQAMEAASLRASEMSAQLGEQ